MTIKHNTHNTQDDPGTDLWSIGGLILMFSGLSAIFINYSGRLPTYSEGLSITILGLVMLFSGLIIKGGFK